MVKAKTSIKQRISSPKKVIKLDKNQFKEHKPLENLTNKANILAAVAECLQAGDLEGVVEVIETYLEALQMAKVYKEREHSSESQDESQSFSSSASVKYASSGNSGRSKKLV